MNGAPPNQEAADYAHALLRKVAEQARSNAVLIEQHRAQAELLTNQQAQIADLAATVRALVAVVESSTVEATELRGSVVELGNRVEVLSHAVLTDEEIHSARASAMANGAGRSIATQVLNGVLGGVLRPGPIPLPPRPPGHPPHPRAHRHQGAYAPPPRGRWPQ